MYISCVSILEFMEQDERQLIIINVFCKSRDDFQEKWVQYLFIFRGVFVCNQNILIKTFACMFECC